MTVIMVLRGFLRKVRLYIQSACARASFVETARLRHGQARLRSILRIRSTLQLQQSLHTSIQA